MLGAEEESRPLIYFKGDIDTYSCLLWQFKVKTFIMFMGH